MEAIVTNPPLNDAQLVLLQSFAHIKNEESLKELNSVLFDFYQTKLDEETDKWWQENEMSVELFEEMCSDMHYRTSYVTK